MNKDEYQFDVRRREVFEANIVVEAAAATLSTSLAKTGLPTQTLTVSTGSEVGKGRIKRIHYRIKPTNAVTYTLRIWQQAVDGTVTPYGQNLALLYESASGRVSDTEYDYTALDIPFKLTELSNIYFSIEWSAAAGNTQGFIAVSGVGE